jgi:polyisoprenoid-binding protein YceI
MRNCFRFRGVLGLAALACSIMLAPAARAQESVVKLDPAQTKITFTVDSTLHNVHGTFQLKSGTIRFDTSTGKASGSIVVDATSGGTDSKARDKKMNEEVLESAKFQEIVFTPNRVLGAIPAAGTSHVKVSGAFRLHGQDHDLTLDLAVLPGSGGRLQVTTDFEVPYIDWGLKDPSSFILRVNRVVNVHIVAIVQQ